MPNIDSYSSLFVALAFGFAIATIVLAWSSADYDRREFVAALKDRAERRDRIKALKLRKRELESEYPKAYMRFRKRVLIVIEETNARRQLYRQTFKANCRYPDGDVHLPPMLKPPKELSSDVPPTAPTSRNDDREAKQEEGEEQ